MEVGASVVSLRDGRGLVRGLVYTVTQVDSHPGHPGETFCRLRRACDGVDVSQGSKVLFRATELSRADCRGVASILHHALVCSASPQTIALLASRPELASALDIFGRPPLEFALSVIAKLSCIII